MPPPDLSAPLLEISGLASGYGGIQVLWGVDLQVLSPPPYMVFTEISGAESARLAREQNEAIAEVVKRYPHSFRGIGAAPCQLGVHGVAHAAHVPLKVRPRSDAAEVALQPLEHEQRGLERVDAVDDELLEARRLRVVR